MNTYLITHSSTNSFIVSAVSADSVERAVKLFNDDIEDVNIVLSDFTQKSDYVWVKDNANIVELDNDYEGVATTRLDNEPA